MEKRSVSRSESRNVNPALSWFGLLTVAANDGNFSAAAAAQLKLAELGWRVDRQPHSRSTEREGSGGQ
jgi:hypothetical protein